MPLTAAIVGFDDLHVLADDRQEAGGGTASEVAAASFRSMPAQKALSPAPVRMATSAASSASKRSNASNRPRRTPASIALYAAGRSIVISATAPCCS